MKESIIKKRNSLHKMIAIMNVAIILCLMIGLNSCKTIAYYDQYAYQETISIKYDALNLVDKATEDFTIYKKDVENLTLRLNKLYEYDKGIGKNAITIQMWEILKNPDGNLLGGFLKRWQDKGKLNNEYLIEKKKQIGESFDKIIGLESKKIRK